MQLKVLIAILLVLAVLAGCAGKGEAEPVSVDEAGPSESAEELGEARPADPIVMANEEIDAQTYALIRSAVEEMFAQIGVDGEYTEIILTQYPVGEAEYACYIEVKVGDRWLDLSLSGGFSQDAPIIELVSEIVDGQRRYYFAEGENLQGIDIYSYQSGEIIS